jgi:hypothetical protein
VNHEIHENKIDISSPVISEVRAIPYKEIVRQFISICICKWEDQQIAY